MKLFAIGIRSKENESRRAIIMDEKLFQDLITGLQEMVDHAKDRKEPKMTVNKSNDYHKETDDGQKTI